MAAWVSRVGGSLAYVTRFFLPMLVPLQKCKGFIHPGLTLSHVLLLMINVCYAGCMVSIGFESVNIRQGGHLTSTDPYILRPTFSLPETK